jgi:hypothetical protein
VSPQSIGVWQTIQPSFVKGNIIMSTQTLSIADAYTQAVNRHDANAYRALFAETARVDDAGGEFNGRAAIQEWSDREIFGAQVTLEPLGVVEKDGETVLTTKVDGNFDRTGLPDPVIISHHIQTDGAKIVQLTCRLVREPLAT